MHIQISFLYSDCQGRSQSKKKVWNFTLGGGEGLDKFRSFSHLFFTCSNSCKSVYFLGGRGTTLIDYPIFVGLWVQIFFSLTKTFVSSCLKKKIFIGFTLFRGWGGLDQKLWNFIFRSFWFVVRLQSWKYPWWVVGLLDNKILRTFPHDCI